MKLLDDRFAEFGAESHFTQETLLWKLLMQAVPLHIGHG